MRSSRILSALLVMAAALVLAATPGAAAPICFGGPPNIVGLPGGRRAHRDSPGTM